MDTQEQENKNTFVELPGSLLMELQNIDADLARETRIIKGLQTYKQALLQEYVEKNKIENVIKIHPPTYTLEIESPHAPLEPLQEPTKEQVEELIGEEVS